jgi:hypothetical protein
VLQNNFLLLQDDFLPLQNDFFLFQDEFCLLQNHFLLLQGDFRRFGKIFSRYSEGLSSFRMNFFLCSELFAFVSLSSSAISSGAVGARITSGVTIFFPCRSLHGRGERKKIIFDL